MNTLILILIAILLFQMILFCIIAIDIQTTGRRRGHESLTELRTRTKCPLCGLVNGSLCPGDPIPMLCPECEQRLTFQPQIPNLNSPTPFPPIELF